MNAIPLLATKITPPPRRASLVPRARLLQQLDLSLLPGNRLTLLSAPAGFGKTTLAADWQRSLAQRGIPLAWLTLDEGDNDLNRFMRYVVAAFQKALPGLGEAALAALDLPQQISVEGLVVPLINDLAVLDGILVVVLDDYQAITALSIHQALAYLIEHQPENLRLVLTTRNDPLLPLARLRARGQVNEIRSADLRFTREEALDFVQQTARLSLNPAQIAQLEERTEGWAAGLQMAAIALGAFAVRNQDPAGLESFLAAFSGTHQYVFDYLAQEVLNQQDPATIGFLEQTAILERLSPSLCDALTGRSDSAQLLKKLESANLFLLPADEQGHWYRYHRLFADFLRAGVDEPHRLDLCRRASDWFEGGGYLEEAVTYALRARDMPRAANLMRDHAPDLFNRGEFSTLLAWFEALPEDVVRADPDLSLYLASSALLSNRIDVAAAWVQQVDQDAGPELTQDSRGRLLGIKAYIAYARGVDLHAAIAWGEEALTLIDPADVFFRLIVLSLLGQIQRQVGSVAAAIRSYEEAIRTSQAPPGGAARPATTGLVILQGNLAISYAIHGELRRAITFCREALQGCLDASGRVAPQSLFLYMPWAEICFNCNELAESRRLIEAGSEQIRRMGTSMTVVGGANILAALNYLQGDREAAQAGLRATQEEAIRLGLPWIASHAATVGAWLELLSGNLAAVETWARDHYRPSQMEGNPLYVVEQMTYIRLLLAQGKAEQASRLLEDMRAQAEQGERFMQLSEIEILLALAQDAQGEPAAALDLFARAARRAAPEGALRIFLSDRTANLVKRLLAGLPEDADETLAAFLRRILSETGGESLPVLRAVRPAKPAGLVEALTPREIEVLTLMAEGLSSAQIARRLVLTINTLKAHTHSIYGKLDAHSRIQAVNRARQLGVLPPPEN